MFWNTRWRSWFRHFATSREVESSISNGVIGIFQWLNPFGSIMAQKLTQRLKEMSTKGISWGKGVRAMGWRPWYFHVPIV